MRIELKVLVILLFINVLTFSASAEEVSDKVVYTIADEIENKSTGQISFYQPIALNERLNKVEADTVSDSEIVGLSIDRDSYNKNKTVGYRIQIYSNNNQVSGKKGAEERERQLLTKYPEYLTYLTFSSPYWRLRVGDFKIKEEAMLYMMQIQKEFPSFANEVRLVKDYITDTL
ncbi:MAG: SPOR domain-containing protein [Bacteroidales bacterium]